MTQIATVERILNAGYAEISVARQSACAHDCAQCAGCGGTPAPVKARAVNPIGAEPGQRVLVESSARTLLGIAALVYLAPVALFLAGYLAGAVLSAPEAVRYGGAVLGFFLGLVPAVLYDRRLGRGGGMAFTIVRFL